MLNIIKNILIKYNLECFGVCHFCDVEKHLIECRAKTLIPNNAQSIITILFPYYIKIGKHNISRYAIVPDYHNVCGNILKKISLELSSAFKNYKFVPFIDNSPFPEVMCGVLSGLGAIGDNNLLINEKYGSWVFIGEIVTDLKLKGSKSYKECLHCGACKAACPGGCLGYGCFNKQNCLSYITQKKGTLEPYEISLIKKSPLIWGCDICQECCPMNLNILETNLPFFKSEIYPNIKPEDYDVLPNRAFHWRPKNVIERNFIIQNKYKFNF